MHLVAMQVERRGGFPADSCEWCRKNPIKYNVIDEDRFKTDTGLWCSRDRNLCQACLDELKTTIEVRHPRLYLEEDK
jgi:hypothetical protein